MKRNPNLLANYEHYVGNTSVQHLNPDPNNTLFWDEWRKFVETTGEYGNTNVLYLLCVIFAYYYDVHLKIHVVGPPHIETDAMETYENSENFQNDESTDMITRDLYLYMDRMHYEALFKRAS